MPCPTTSPAGKSTFASPSTSDAVPATAGFSGCPAVGGVLSQSTSRNSAQLRRFTFLISIEISPRDTSTSRAVLYVGSDSPDSPMARVFDIVTERSNPTRLKVSSNSRYKRVSAAVKDDSASSRQNPAIRSVYVFIAECVLNMYQIDTANIQSQHTHPQAPAYILKVKKYERSPILIQK